jgi:hypothetical protein
VDVTGAEEVGARRALKRDEVGEGGVVEDDREPLRGQRANGRVEEWSKAAPATCTATPSTSRLA